MIYDNYYLDIAEAVAKRSKCISLNVGCVIVKNDQIISTGINGTPKYYTNCQQHWYGRSEEDRKNHHHEWSAKYEIHAEMNAIIRAGQSIENCKVYCTHSPCFNCVKHLVAAGIHSIYYRHRYKRLTETDLADIINFTKQCNVGYKEVTSNDF